MIDKRPFWKTKTFWGCVALFLSGGLDSIGLGALGGIVQSIATLIGIPLTVYGGLDRLRK